MITSTKSSNYQLEDRDLVLSHGESQRLTGQYVLRVKDLPDAEKPREKLQELGPANRDVTP